MIVHFFQWLKITQSGIDLGTDLKKISEWVFQLKMNFVPDPTKQARKLIFSRKSSQKRITPRYFLIKILKSKLFY